MRLLRILGFVALLAVAAWVGYRFFSDRQPEQVAARITVYYCKTDGQTLVPWTISLGSARDPKSVAFYATAQTLAGPPSGIDAIRFPAGTIARSLAVNGSTAAVDLSGSVGSNPGGSFAESGEFKALVWSLTEIPGINAVRITIDGKTVAALPGGHLELDQALTRQNW